MPSVNVTIDLKALLAAILAFATVYFVQQPTFMGPIASKVGISEKQEIIVIFIVLLVVQVLFEILYKYEGKTCEITEGIFAALFAILGYFAGVSIAGKISEIREQQGGDVTIYAGAGGAALGIWIWKRWLKFAILPINCAPCDAPKA